MLRYRGAMEHSRTFLLFAAVCCFVASFSPPARAAIFCAGDCNHDGPVGLSELVGVVDIALGESPVSRCAAGDINRDNHIGIDEIVAAVHVTLIGCPGFDFDTTTEAHCDPIAAPCMLP